MGEEEKELLGQFEESLPDEDEERIEEEAGGEVEEGQRAKPLPQPNQPTKAQIQEHELTHIPFRSWCVHCVKGKTRSAPHRPQVEEQDVGVTTWSMDYCFASENLEKDRFAEGQEQEARGRETIMVCHDKRTGGVFTYLVKSKGVGDGWIVDRIVGDLEECGYGGTTIKIKCDQEPAILEVQRAIAEKRAAGKTVPENSPVGDSRSNGRAENTIGRFQGNLRTILSDLEANLGIRVRGGHPLFPWAVKWAGDVMTRYALNASGRTAIQEIRGTKSYRSIAKFGEKIFYMPLKLANRLPGKMDDRVQEGIFLGMRLKSDEIIVGTAKGAVKARTIKRLPEDQQWNRDFARKMQGTPQRPDPAVKSDRLTSVISEHIERADEGLEEAERGQQDVEEEVERKKTESRPEPMARRMYVKKSDVERYGKTDNCPGCIGLTQGKQVTHSQDCRERMKREMMKDDLGRERIRKELARADGHLEKALQQELESHPQLQQEQRRHEEDLNQRRKRALEGPPDAHRKERRAVGDELPQDTGGASRSGCGEAMQPSTQERGMQAKRKAEGPCEGEETRGDQNGRATEVRESMDMSYIGHWGADIAEVLGQSAADQALAADRCSDEIDFTVADEQGVLWNFDRVDVRNKAFRMIVEKKPYLLIGCSMGRASNVEDKRGGGRRSFEGRKQDEESAEVHLKFIAQLYRLQHRQGRYFLHEHPNSTFAGGATCVQQIREAVGAHVLSVDAPSRAGSSGKRGVRFATNSPALAVVLREECLPETREAIEKGMRVQKEWDQGSNRLIGVFQGGDAQQRAEEMERRVPAEEADGVAWDDISGKELDAAKVREARRLEMEYYKKMEVYEKVPLNECWMKTGKAPLKARWIDTDKGTRYRSRWVAKQFRDSDAEEWFAATPPIEALRAVLSHATTGKETKAVMVNDVSRAFFYAPVQHEIYVELCEEAITCEEDRGKCAKLLKSMYGTKAAAQNWQRAVQNKMRKMGFVVGKSSAVLFYHPVRDVWSLVHGDDFVSSGSPEDLAWVRQELEGAFEITSTVIGASPDLGKELTVLNRTIRWHDNVGISYEADQRHAKAIIAETQADGMRTVSTPMVKEDKKESEKQKDEDIKARKQRGILNKKSKEEGEDLLGPAEATRYRALAARANYLAIDRGDILYAAKELTRKMSAPTVGDWGKLERLGRYLKGRPRVVLWYKHQEDPGVVEAYSDTDWAGCRRTRRSTTGGLIRRGRHLLKTWCKTQAVIALSSAEAELYGLVRASAEALGIASMFKDFGRTVSVQVLGDASAALAVIQRQGIGRIRHLDTSYLWVQEKSMRGEVEYRRVAGKENGADLFTKPLTWEEIERHSTNMEQDIIDDTESLEKAKREVLELIKREEVQGKIKLWPRVDLGTRTLKTSMKGGPAWSTVLGRATVDMETGEVMDLKMAREITRDAEHAVMPGAARDTVTVLAYS